MFRHPIDMDVILRHNYLNTESRVGWLMSKDTHHKDRDEKCASLRRYHALNPHPERVTDEAFTSDNPFFDPRDLVQVKYEMLRRVHKEGLSVTRAAASFGFSRPSFYQAQTDFQEAGLVGLLPERPGPRRAHKLTDEVVEILEELRLSQPSLSTKELAAIVRDRFGVSVHPRSIERALLRCQKKRK